MGRDRHRLLGDVTSRIAARWPIGDVLLTDSGTSALTLALGLVQQRRPDCPIAFPAYGCFDLVTAAVGAGISVWFYDIDPATLGPDLRSLERGVARGLGGVVVAYLYGLPFDLAPVVDMTAASGIPLIEDAAQGVGMRINDRPSGTMGDLAVLSFGRGKGLTAGRGGALLSRDPIDVDGSVDIGPPEGTAREIVMLAAQWLLARPSLYRLPAAVPWLHLGETVYRAPHRPRRPTSFALGVLGSTLGMDEAETVRRRRNASLFRTVLQGSPRGTTPRFPETATPGFLRFPVVCHREPGLTARDRSLGLMPGYPTALPRLGTIRHRTVNPGDLFPGADRLVAKLVTLPTHSRLTAGDIRNLSGWLQATEARK